MKPSKDEGPNKENFDKSRKRSMSRLSVGSSNSKAKRSYLLNACAMVVGDVTSPKVLSHKKDVSCYQYNRHDDNSSDSRESDDSVEYQSNSIAVKFGNETCTMVEKTQKTNELESAFSNEYKSFIPRNKSDLLLKTRIEDYVIIRYDEKYNIPFKRMIKYIKVRDTRIIDYRRNMERPQFFRWPLFQQQRETICKRLSMGYPSHVQISSENIFYCSEITKNLLFSHQMSGLSLAMFGVCYNPEFCAEMLWKIGNEVLMWNKCGHQFLLSFYNMMRLLCLVDFTPQVVMDYACSILIKENSIDEAYQLAIANYSHKKCESDVYFNTFVGSFEYAMWKLEWLRWKSSSVKNGWKKDWGDDEEEDDELNEDEDPMKSNAQMTFHGQRAIQCLKNVEKKRGIWDLVLPKYIELLTYYEGKGRAVDALLNHMTTNPDNPNSYEYYLHYVYEPSEKLVKILETYCAVNPFSDDWGKELLTSYRSSGRYSDMLLLLVKRLDHKVCADSLFDWHMLYKLFAVRDKIKSEYFEQYLRGDSSFARHHFAIPLDRRNHNLCEKVLRVKSKIADCLNIDGFSDCVEAWLTSRELKQSKPAERNATISFNIFCDLDLEQDEEEGEYDELTCLSSPNIISSEEYGNLDDNNVLKSNLSSSSSLEEILPHVLITPFITIQPVEETKRAKRRKRLFSRSSDGVEGMPTSDTDRIESDDKPLKPKRETPKGMKREARVKVGDRKSSERKKSDRVSNISSISSLSSSSDTDGKGADGKVLKPKIGRGKAIGKETGKRKGKGKGCGGRKENSENRVERSGMVKCSRGKEKKTDFCCWCNATVGTGDLKNFHTILMNKEIYCTELCSEKCFVEAAHQILRLEKNIIGQHERKKFCQNLSDPSDGGGDRMLPSSSNTDGIEAGEEALTPIKDRVKREKEKSSESLRHLARSSHVEKKSVSPDYCKTGVCRWCNATGGLKNFYTILMNKEIYCTELCSEKCFVEAARHIIGNHESSKSHCKNSTSLFKQCVSSVDRKKENISVNPAGFKMDVCCTKVRENTRKIMKNIYSKKP